LNHSQWKPDAHEATRARGDRVENHKPERSTLPDQVLTLPAFELPFPSDISPITDSIIDHACWWAQAVELVANTEAVQRLRRNGIMHAGPRLVPAAPMSAAFLVCDWTVFLIVIDDEFDDGRELGARPELARTAIEEVLAAFRDQALEPAHSFPSLAGISAAVADLGRRFEAISPSRAWLARFLLHAEEHLWSKVSEAEQRASGTILDIDSYIELRRITSAAYTYADLVEMTEQVAVAEQVREAPAWTLMLDAFADAWLGIQDICSCAKEVAAGDELNLAAVMARSAKGTLQQGVDDAYRWVCERSSDFTGQRAHLVSLARHLGLGKEAEMNVMLYLDALELLLGGHIAWNSQDNPRYSQVISRT
jgi:hypothetical protein